MIIYEPKGPAREYSELACNLYSGCQHGCTYCYVPGIPPWKFGNKETFHQASKPRDRVVDLFRIDAKKHYGDPREILFCFTSDPFQFGRENSITMECLEIAEQNKLKLQILTKGGMCASVAFPIIARNGWKFAQTVVFSSDELRKKYEPNASSIANRLEAAKKAKECGCYVWISMEPVIDCSQAKEVYQLFRQHADLFKIGKINHDKKLEDAQDWKSFCRWIRDAVPAEKLFLKDSLKPYMAMLK